MELLAAGRTGTKPPKRAHRADFGACACQGCRSSRRDSLLHPRGRGLRPAEARGALRRPVAWRRSRRGPPGAHAEPHLLPRGRYLDALGDNKTAMAVDETYLAANEVPMGVYRLGYYPHNVHFVMASALMAGDGPSGITAAEKLRGLVPDQAALAIPGAHPVKAAPYFAHTLFSPPDTILALPDPGNAIPYVKAMWHYARGI